MHPSFARVLFTWLAHGDTPRPRGVIWRPRRIVTDPGFSLHENQRSVAPHFGCPWSHRHPAHSLYDADCRVENCTHTNSGDHRGEWDDVNNKRRVLCVVWLKAQETTEQDSERVARGVPKGARVRSCARTFSYFHPSSSSGSTKRCQSHWAPRDVSREVVQRLDSQDSCQRPPYPNRGP